MIKVPRLALGKGFKGPEFYGCFNTGMAPAIFHSRTGKYVVGLESPCREAMRQCVTHTNKRAHGTDNRRVYIYKGRGPAVQKFMELCGAQILENAAVRQKHLETARKAASGDMAAALALGDF